MTTIKFDSKLVAGVAASIERFAGEMFRDQAGRWMAVVELAHVERTEPGDFEEKEASAKLRIVGIEIAPDEEVDEQLRQAQRDLYARRTKAGTLDEHMPPGATRPDAIVQPALPAGRSIELEAIDAEVVSDHDEPGDVDDDVPEEAEHEADEPADLDADDDHGEPDDPEADAA